MMMNLEATYVRADLLLLWLYCTGHPERSGAKWAVSDHGEDPGREKIRRMRLCQEKPEGPVMPAGYSPVGESARDSTKALSSSQALRQRMDSSFSCRQGRSKKDPVRHGENRRADLADLVAAIDHKPGPVGPAQQLPGPLDRSGIL